MYRFVLYRSNIFNHIYPAVQAICGNGQLSGMSEQEALKTAKEFIDSMVDFPYNLSVIKMTFRPGAYQKEIENYLDGFREGAHFEEYDGSGNAQDCCSFILQEGQAKNHSPREGGKVKKAILVTFTVTTRKVIEVPEGTDLDQLQDKDLLGITEIAKSYIIPNASDYFIPDNMSISEDKEVPAGKDEIANYKI